MPVVLVDARCKVNDTEFTFVQFKFGGKYVGVFEVILRGAKGRILRHDAEFAAFLRIEQRTENETTVEPWHTKPVYIGMGVNIRQVGAVANDAKIVLVDIGGHTIKF